MEQEIWRGMPYYDVFWRKRHLTRRELRAIYANYYTYVFWALAISMLVLLDLHGFAERVSLSALVAYTVSLVIITVSFYFLGSWLGLKLSKKYAWFFMIYPLLGFVAVSISTYIVELGMSGYFRGAMSVEQAAGKLPENIILTLVLETFYITFVLPIATQFGKRRDKKPLSDAQNTCTTLSIAGKTFFCDQLISVSSQDHYVKVKTDEGEVLLRARLSDLIGQLSCQNGIQPHRSHWVSRRAVAEIKSRDGHKCLVLTDGSPIPIARGRMVDVQAWLEKQG